MRQLRDTLLLGLLALSALPTAFAAVGSFEPHNYYNEYEEHKQSLALDHPLAVRTREEIKRMIALGFQFDGKPVQFNGKPFFECFSYTKDRWVNCGDEYDAVTRRYVLQRPPPGRYRLHVSIDENPANPQGYPGDYEAQPNFEVTENGPHKLVVDLARLIRLTSPGDTNTSIEGMFGDCELKPTLATGTFSWNRRANVRFAWDTIVDGATYRYDVFLGDCTPYKIKEKIISEATTVTEAIVGLPPNAPGESYLFRVTAYKDGRMAGILWTHDGNGYWWDYRFVIVDGSLPNWAYGAALGGLLLVLVAIRSISPRTRKSVAGRAAIVPGRGVHPQPVARAAKMNPVYRVALTALVLANVAAGAAVYYFYYGQPSYFQNEILAVDVVKEDDAKLFIDVDYYYTGDHGNDDVWIGAITLTNGSSTGYWSYRPMRIRQGRHTVRIKIGMNKDAPDRYQSDHIVISMYRSQQGSFAEKTVQLDKQWSK